MIVVQSYIIGDMPCNTYRFEVKTEKSVDITNSKQFYFKVSSFPCIVIDKFFRLKSLYVRYSELQLKNLLFSLSFERYHVF